MKGSDLTQNVLPVHVAFIMDGNRRWAKKHHLPVAMGHKKGFEAFKEVVDYAFHLGVHYVTVYAFSTENWQRESEEVTALLELLHYAIDREVDNYKSRDIRINFLGDKSSIPTELRTKIESLESDTKKCQSGSLNIAFSYGGRAEIVSAVKEILAEGESVSEESIGSHLYTAGQPDPDIVIRSGGQPRLSNFLLWQSSYSELYFTDVLWPDMDKAELDKAFSFFSNIKRTFGR